LAAYDGRVTEAVFGLLGVVVGGVLTGGVNLWLERRREAAEARAARRLLRAEVSDALAGVERALDEGKWPIAWKKTWAQSWSTYRRPLAAGMPSRNFDAVAASYARMELLQAGFAAERDDRSLSSSDRDFLTDIKPHLAATLRLFDERR
jgi:hypothetical protein